MERIDRLIARAKRSLYNEVDFEDEDDSFIKALGLDPEKYKTLNEFGFARYDCNRALADTIPDTWSGWNEN